MSDKEKHWGLLEQMERLNDLSRQIFVRLDMLALQRSVLKEKAPEIKLSDFLQETLNLGETAGVPRAKLASLVCTGSMQSNTMKVQS